MKAYLNMYIALTARKWRAVYVSLMASMFVLRRAESLLRMKALMLLVINRATYFFGGCFI